MADAAPASASSARHWIWPLALAASAHLAWMLWKPVPTIPMRPAYRDSAPARVAYAPAKSQDIDARFIWSPVIFSLASGKRDGTAGSGHDISLPPVVIPEDPPPFMGREATAAPAAVLQPTGLQKNPVWDVLAARKPLPPPPAFEVDRIGEGPALDPAWARSFSTDAAGRHSWEASIQIEFGVDGLPGSVVVDGADIPEAARENLSRTAFGWRRPVSDQPVTLRVRVHYSPSISSLPETPSKKPDVKAKAP